MTVVRWLVGLLYVGGVVLDLEPVKRLRYFVFTVLLLVFAAEVVEYFLAGG